MSVVFERINPNLISQINDIFISATSNRNSLVEISPIMDCICKNEWLENLEKNP